MTIVRFCHRHGEYRGRSCPRCLKEREARRGSTTQRGLGADHQRRRAALIASGARICWLCGKAGSWDPADPDPLTADHVMPRAAGGRLSELRPAHRSCNSGRGARAAQGRQDPPPPPLIA
jgi:5-methylcytosine-specific restriction endonuclease McrA